MRPGSQNPVAENQLRIITVTDGQTSQRAGFQEFGRATANKQTLRQKSNPYQNQEDNRHKRDRSGSFKHP